MSDASGTEDSGRSTDGRGFLAFWKTLPGVLTGIAGLLTAVGGLVATWLQVTGGPEPGPSTETESSLHTPETAANPTSPTKTSGAAGELYRDRIEMYDTDFVDLETGKLGKPPPNDDFYLHGTDQILASYGMTPVSGPITKDACASALTDRNNGGASISQVADDQWLCVQTREGHLGGIQITERAAPGKPFVVFDYVLWE